jgi:hypothetical protein
MARVEETKIDRLSGRQDMTARLSPKNSLFVYYYQNAQYLCSLIGHPWFEMSGMKKTRLSKKEEMIAAFYSDHAERSAVIILEPKRFLISSSEWDFDQQSDGLIVVVHAATSLRGPAAIPSSIIRIRELSPIFSAARFSPASLHCPCRVCEVERCRLRL